MDVDGLLSEVPLARESPHLELALALADKPPIIPAIVKVDVSIPASAIDSVMALLSSKVNNARLHASIKFMKASIKFMKGKSL